MNAVAGWYADPSGNPNYLRFWTGTEWTNDFKELDNTPRPAGWYPNPNGDIHSMRFWDGSDWTDKVKNSQTQYKYRTATTQHEIKSLLRRGWEIVNSSGQPELVLGQQPQGGYAKTKVSSLLQRSRISSWSAPWRVQKLPPTSSLLTPAEENFKAPSATLAFRYSPTYLVGNEDARPWVTFDLRAGPEMVTVDAGR